MTGNVSTMSFIHCFLSLLCFCCYFPQFVLCARLLAGLGFLCVEFCELCARNKLRNLTKSKLNQMLFVLLKFRACRTILTAILTKIWQVCKVSRVAPQWRKAVFGERFSNVQLFRVFLKGERPVWYWNVFQFIPKRFEDFLDRNVHILVKFGVRLKRTGSVHFAAKRLLNSNFVAYFYKEDTLLNISQCSRSFLNVLKAF